MFIKHFIRDKMVGALAPTSFYGVKKVCKLIDFSKDNIIVEYGPGNGVFTKYLLDKASKDSMVVAVETNDKFISDLQRIYDDRLVIIKESAENIKSVMSSLKIDKADYIISGIPLTYLSKEQKKNLMSQTHSVLSEDGKFLIYQYSNHPRKYLKPLFDDVRFHMEPRNLPPLFINEARK
ncbi:MAG: class I SAM-dependent methyltransferase [Nanobdellota archaeon]